MALNHDGIDLGLNLTLLKLAHLSTAQNMQKSAVVPAGGGAPPMDPAMMGGGAPPMDPAMMGGAPPMDPAMMGAAPPVDPAMAGAAPPVDPAMAGAAPPAAPPAPAAPGAAPAAPPKLKPEDRINQVDFRLYNMQQQLTAIMHALNVQLPAGALVTPPGSPVPVAEAATPGGAQDPGPSAQGGAQGGDQSGIAPIEAMQAFDPAGGGGQKEASIHDMLRNIVGRGVQMEFVQEAEESAPFPQQPQPPVKKAAVQEGYAVIGNQLQSNVAAAAAILRSRLR